MKKLISRGLLLVASMLTAGFVSAQMPGQMPPMPVDSAVRVGKLDNGLTYYIRHNETPKGQADFYIAQKVGSILEEDHQRGLAHFLEHMCFNGTENFPGNTLIDWLESVGVKFGYNLNAYTAVDQTVYNISSVPVARKSVQDSCLLILHDWACALTLDPEEIDKERGVIHEEWRRSMVGQQRIVEELLPKIYAGNKYGYRLPIGTMEVVDNFEPQALVDYYHTWYRPDQQGIIVVGDIDPDYIEAKIKELFSPIKMPENAKERTYLTVEDTPGTIYAIGSDKEQPNGIAMMSFKTDPLIPKELRNTQAFFPVFYMKTMVSNMLDARLDEEAKKTDTAYASAGVSVGNDFWLSSTKESLDIQVVAKGDDIIPGFKQVYRELLRAARGGFTVGEYERARAEFLSYMERLYESRNNTQTESYSTEYVNSFIKNDPIPGIEVEYEMYKQIAPMLPVEVINQLLPELIKPDNRVFVALLPDNGKFIIPTEEQVAAAIAEVEAEDIEPYRDEMKTEPLIPALPAAGSVTAVNALPVWDATEYTLSNGVKVIVKPTTFKDNEIIFAAIAKGGLSTIGDDNAASLIFLDYAMGNHGLGDYTSVDLQKYMQGKQATVQANFDEYQRSIDGTTTVKDLPTLMELIYMTFVGYNITADEFEATQNQFKGILGNQETSPQYVFSRDLYKALYESPARQMVSTDIIDAANREASLEIIHKMLANAADYTFIFVGNIDMETFKPLMEQYIATLPVDAAKSVPYVVNPARESRKENIDKHFTTPMETPQTWTYIGYAISEPFDAKDRLVQSAATQILSNRLLKKVREEMGATYSIGSYGSIGRLGDVNSAIQIPFPMKPELKNEVLAAIDEILDGMTTSVTDEDLNPIKEYLVKNATEAMEENTSWVNGIAGYQLNNVNTFTTALDNINSITTADVMNYVKNMRTNGYHYQILLDAE